MFVAMVSLMALGGLLVAIVDDLWRFHPLTVFLLAFATYMLIRTLIWLAQRAMARR